MGYRGGGGGRRNDIGMELNTNINWDLSKLPVFEKNFYHEHPDITAMPEEEASQWRASNEIVCLGKDIPKPVLTFETSPFPGMLIFLFVVSGHLCSQK